MDIRPLEPFITWPKNIVLGGVRGIMEGINIGATWGLRLGAAAGLAAGVFGWFPALLGEVGSMAAISGVVVGGISGVGLAIAGGAAIGMVSGAIYGVTHSGADHSIVEDRIMGKRLQRARAQNQGKDDQMHHFLDDLADQEAAMAEAELEAEAHMRDGDSYFQDRLENEVHDVHHGR